MIALIFQLSNLYILPWWLLMIVLPDWHGTKRAVSSPWIIAPLAVPYTLLVAPTFIDMLPTLMNPQLDALTQLVGTATGTTVAWIHIICFDLWVGRWVYMDSDAITLSRWVRRIALLCVLMAGPFGALVYLVIRSVTMRKAARVHANH